MQLILSVQAGKISSATLIRQLSHRSQRLPYAALTEPDPHTATNRIR